MSAHQDPPRLFSPESGADAELRRALGAARDDLPSTDRLEAILAKLPLDAPPGDGGGGGPDGGGLEPGAGGAPDIGSIAPAAGAATTVWMKVAGVVGLGAALAGITYVSTRPEAPPSNVASAPAAASVTATPSARAAEPASIPSAIATASASGSAAKTASAPVVQPSSSAPVRSEIEILKEAQAALGSSPARALALTEEHARSHPKGSLGQEREMVRIQALVALGRTEEARSLAEAFKKRNPSSAYAQRLDAMFP